LHISIFGLVLSVLGVGYPRDSLGGRRRLRHNLNHADLGSVGISSFVGNGRDESVDLKSGSYTHRTRYPGAPDSPCPGT
jgi:hypothetical protein